PNPHLVYTEDELGASQAPPGNISVELSQEIVTAGKRRLDKTSAAREVDAAEAGFLARKFETLTRVRRAYFEYLTLESVYEARGAATAAIVESVDATRKLVETAGTRPKSDLLRLEAALEEARSE